jgi:O-antigen/teichoic acid export membrane protein
MTETSPPSVPPKQLVEGWRKFLRNTGFSLVHQVATVLIAVALVPYMLWHLGTERYGLWLVLQIFNIFGLVSLAELGFQGAIVRHLVRYHSAGDTFEFRRLLATSFLLFLAIGALCALAVLTFARTSFLDVFSIPPGYGPEMRQALSLYALSLLVSFPALVIKAFYSGMQNVATLKVWELVDRVAFASALAGILLLTDRLLYLVLVEQVAMISVLAVFLAIARVRHGRWFTLDPRIAAPRSLNKVLGMSGMVFVSNLSSQVYVKAPEALIGAILGPVALAHFTIATRIPRLIKTVQGAINAAVLPYAALLDTDPEGRETKRRFALFCLRVCYLVFVPTAAFVVIFASDILRLWVGSEYIWLSSYLILAMLWQLAAVVTNFGAATFTSTAHYRKAVWRNLALNLVFLAAFVPAVQHLALAGAFGTLFLASFASMAVMLIATRHANAFSYLEFWRQVVIGPVIISGVIALASFGLGKMVMDEAGPIAAAIGLALLAPVYLAMLYRAVLFPHERDYFRAALAKLTRGT